MRLYNLKWVKAIGLFTSSCISIVVCRNVFLSSKPKNYNQYDTAKSALLIDFKTNTSYAQDFNGGYEYVVNYKISYKYEMLGKTYFKTQILQPITENTSITNLVKQLQVGTDSVAIRIDSDRPGLSTLEH